MLDEILVASKKIENCIKTSDTSEHLETSRRMLDNFIKLYDVPSMMDERLEWLYEQKYLELNAGVE